jgi:hypothetical protein
MIDPALLEELRRLVNASKLPEYMRDLERAVPTDLVRQIANDFRNYSPTPKADPRAKVVPVGAGRVIDGSDAPVASTGTGGWVEPPKVDSWRPPGLEHMDRMMDAQDAIDRLQRVRELGEAKALVQAEAELIKQQAELNKKQKEPKP